MSQNAPNVRSCPEQRDLIVSVRLGHHERRTLWVVGLTAIMMVIELVVGMLTRSLALTADGWHMATHAGALGLSALAYWFARTRAGLTTFTFGTGKVYALAGYTNAVLLLVVAVMMVIEAVRRFWAPVHIRFDEALPIAVLGLLVNLVSAKLLDPAVPHAHAEGERVHDHNLHAAYLHVLADALTSLLAIAALVGGRYLGLAFLDSAVAVVGSIVIVRWGIGLCRSSARQLLDAAASTEIAEAIRNKIEAMDDARVVDLHLWEIGPGRLGCIVSLLASTPRPVDEYRRAVLESERIEHLTVEVLHRPTAS